MSRSEQKEANANKVKWTGRGGVGETLGGKEKGKKEREGEGGERGLLGRAMGSMVVVCLCPNFVFVVVCFVVLYRCMYFIAFCAWRLPVTESHPSSVIRHQTSVIFRLLRGRSSDGRQQHHACSISACYSNEALSYGLRCGIGALC